MTKKLYYYTSHADYWIIYNLGLIWTHDGSQGEGVYLTEIPPGNGRMKVFENVCAGDRKKYAKPEVCLETSADEINATSFEEISGHSIWIARSQLLFSDFKFGYFWSNSNSAWKMISLKSQIKLEHLTLMRTKSPLTQLKELLDRQGLMSDFQVTRCDELYVCTATYRDKTAKGEGRSQKGSKNAAAKNLIRQMFLAKTKTDSQSWEQLVSEDTKKNHQISKNVNGNVSHSASRYDCQLSQDGHLVKLGTTCNKENVNKIMCKKLPESIVPASHASETRASVLGEKKMNYAAVKMFQDMRIARSPLTPSYKWSSGNVAEVRRPNYMSEAKDFTRSENDRPAHDYVTGCAGIKHNESNMMSKVKSAHLCQPQMSGTQTSEIHACYIEDKMNIKTLSKRFEEICCEGPSSISAYKHSPEVTAKVLVSNFRSTASDILGSGNDHRAQDDCAGYSESAHCDEVNQVKSEKLHESKIFGTQPSETRSLSTRDKINSKTMGERIQEICTAGSSPVPAYQRSSENITKFSSCVSEAKDFTRSGNDRPAHYYITGCAGIKYNESNMISKVKSAQPHMPGTQTSEIHAGYIEDKINIKTVSKRFEEICCEGLSPTSAYKHTPEVTAKVLVSNFRSTASDILRSGNDHRAQDDGTGYGESAHCGEVNQVKSEKLHESKIFGTQPSETRSPFTRDKINSKTLGERIQEICAVRSSLVPAYQRSSENITKVPSYDLVSKTEDIAASGYDHSLRETQASEIRICFVREKECVNTLTERFRELRLRQTSPVPTYERFSSGSFSDIRSSSSESVVEDLPGSETPRKLVSSPEMSPRLTGHPMASTRVAGGRTAEIHPQGTDEDATGNLQDTKDDEVVLNAIGALQNMCVKRRWQCPVYQEVLPEESELGTFTNDCLLLGLRERGTGYNKKLAKQQAALKMLKKVRNIKRGCEILAA